ncbi:Uncharacterized protein Rs2_37651 [Raphanus sativus]|uniref:Uncharacterized protein LOC108822854 n=1 Tax=Raphanus sativus TaxID=3726 RepID=A0A9W3CA81_RAPSA|nr:uncharacterized protein LOC108822854 [Raphanus sativus]KAJ4880596.1 Uncharacterized protein Rs2_37651 [Raphanus sativus]
MQRPEGPRIDLAALKGHIVKKIGVERSRRYFYYLGRFLSQKLTKSEFDKSCLRLLGRENLPLHNKLIHSILKNASLAKSPPPPPPHKSLVLGKEDGPNRNDHVWSNGVLPKVRSGMCVGTIRDRPSPLGPNGKVESSMHHKPGRYSDERVPLAPVSIDDEAQDERGRLVLSKGPVTAPLGVSFCAGGARRTVPVSTRADFTSCYDSGGLSDAEMLRKRMENIAVAQGLGGVSGECSSMLSNVLDVYLKKLIKSCVDLSGARSRQSREGILNGVWPSNSLQIQTSNRPSDMTQEQHQVSLLDFRVAVELNPAQLGEDWPLLRERMLLRSFEERDGV